MHKRAIDWAHAKGIKARLHSCGDVNPFLPELIEIGLDGLNPLEVKAGMDPIHVKRTYGDQLLLHGGINAVLWDDRDAIAAEMRQVIPVVKENGGYIFASDHSHTVEREPGELPLHSESGEGIRVVCVTARGARPFSRC
ncbi:MAG: hypothetical protein M5R40_21040 [Anaerolineae bacterium]|nr:hypothetical protein [Anaerolineae bacterium]